MDSGNSGSLQSSSGGDEEYDSILHSSGGGATLSTTLPATTTHHHQHHPPSSLYDTLSYYDAFPRSPPNPFLNIETPWSRSSPRPPLDPTCTNDITGLFPTSSPVTSSINPFSLATPTTKPSPAPPDPPPRNSKKRSRASRRAPTTVLTTDTSNFRAMVQEFTGIPAAPFAASSSSSFPRSRLDIFSGRSSTFHDSLLAPPPYLLRPFAQKVQATSFAPLSCSSSSTSLIDAIASSSSSSSSNAASTSSAATLNARPSSTCTNPTQTNNYQVLPHDLGLNMQNQMLTFQSLLQPPINTTTPKYTLPNIPSFTDKSRSNDHPPQVIPDFGHVGNLDNGDVNLAGNLSSLVGGAEGGDQPQLRHGSCKINF